MGTFIFRAQSPNGEVSGVEEADTAAQAVEQLESRGLSDIRLQNHILSAAQPLDTHGLAEDDYVDTVLYFQEHQGWRAFTVVFLRQNGWILLLLAALAAWQFYLGHLIWGAGLLALPITLVVWSAWKYRDAELFSSILKDIAFGRWQEALQSTETLAARVKDDGTLMELAVYEACLLARQGERAEADVILGLWKPVMKAVAPGHYESSQARMAHAAGDYQAVRDFSRQAMEATDGDASMTLDHALMEARYGSPARAHCLVMDVDARLLPEPAYAFVPWVTGIIALKQGRMDEALMALQEALTGFQPLAENPAVWPTLAAVAGDLGLALLEKQESQRAMAAVKPVWAVLQAHGDPQQVATLEAALPGLSD